MKLLALLLVVSLSGCATAPPWLAAIYDNNDPCQVKGKQPNFCGASNNRNYIYNNGGNQVGYIKK